MTINAALRFKVLHRDKFTCQYCGTSAPMARIEVDHIKPRLVGGESVPANLVTACLRCNKGKGIGYTVNGGTNETEMSALQEGREGSRLLRELLCTDRVPGPQRGHLGRARSTRPNLAEVASGPKIERLSLRQRQLIIHVRTGATNREIAAEFGLSEQTVKNHLIQIYRVIGIRNRAELVALRM